MHVFLTGPVQIGKSTLIAAALEQLRPERLGGFRTVSAKPEADGSRPVYLHPAAAQDLLCEVYNRVGIRHPASHRFRMHLRRQGLPRWRARRTATSF